jgi:hypothetical protein
MEIVQVCYMVKDLEQACEKMHRLLGVGPFLGGVEFDLTNHKYRGEPARPVTLKGAFVQSGELNIELLELKSEGPSAFHDMYLPGEEGIHHVAMFCVDYEQRKAELVARGCTVASEFTFGNGIQIGYIDARHILGHMIEIYPNDPTIHNMYRVAREAPSRWDGQNLIVPWEDA